MPKKVEECVDALMKDPDFKPRKQGQSKRSAAYAVCTAQHKESQKKQLGVGQSYEEPRITEHCFCAECGKKTPHKSGTLCQETNCPDCNEPMIPKEQKSFPMRITKATIRDGEMYWQGAISDTDWDAENERMALSLFDDFKYHMRLQLEEKPFVSLSHYKRMEDGSGELGTVEDIWTQSHSAKAEGHFHDNRLGKRLFEVVQKELQLLEAGEEISDPVRFSIGFYPGETAKDDDGRIIYLKGKLDHVAVTRVPVNPRTGFTYVEKAMAKTRQEDALSIVGDEYIEDVESLDEKQRTEKADLDDLIIKSEEEDSPLNEEQEVILRASLADEDEETIEKAVWTYAYKKSLPDSAYAWVETGSGCEKKDGQRPQKCRHLPFKTKEGSVDCRHTRAALQAIGGARQDKPMKGVPSKAKTKLQRALKSSCQKGKAEILEVELTEYEQGRIDGYNAALDFLLTDQKDEETTTEATTMSSAINEEVVALEPEEEKAEVVETVEADPIDQHIELLKGVLAAESSSRSEKVQNTEAVLRSLAAHCQSVINESTPIGPEDIAESLKSQVSEAVKPLQDEIAVLKKLVSEGTQPESPTSKALKGVGFNISPEESLRAAQGDAQPESTIKRIARTSTGLDAENL